MSEKKGISRRGILKGEWLKIIRDRGLLQLEQEAEPEFVIKAPSNRARRGKSFQHRPPHAVAESEFVAGCTKCDACIQACPPHAIYRAPESEGQLAGFPIIDPESQPCLMCDDLPCVPACEVGVLRLDAPIAMALAKIDSDYLSCISRNSLHSLC